MSPQDFAAAVACGYVTPGPVLITATFIGYRAAGLSGAVAATFGVFLMPWLLAAAAAQQLQRFMQHPRLAGFGRGAAPAVVGLLGVTALSVAKHSFTHWGYALIAIDRLGACPVDQGAPDSHPHRRRRHRLGHRGLDGTCDAMRASRLGGEC